MAAGRTRLGSSSNILLAGSRSTSTLATTKTCLCPPDTEADQGKQDEEDDDDEEDDNVALHLGGVVVRRLMVRDGKAWSLCSGVVGSGSLVPINPG